MAGRVFISYSHDSEAHADRVLDFARLLRDRGIDAWIDQYEESPPEGWPRWCREQCRQAKFVVAVCTRNYRERFEATAPSDIGKGVSWEGFVLTQILYEQQGRNTQILPVLLEGATPEDVPSALRSSTVYSLEQPSDLEKLYRRLSGQPRTPAPELGPPVAMPPKERKSLFEAPVPRSASLPGVGPVVGRTNEVKDTVTALLAYQPVLLLGPGGIGKSTVTLAALHDPQVAARYGNRRYFIDLSVARSAEAVVSELARTLEIHAPSDPRGAVIAELQRAPVALALDNLETPWEQPAATAQVEQLLSQLVALKSSGVCIVGSVRGDKRPGGVAWRPLQVKSLSMDESRQLFIAIAGDAIARDPLLDGLLADLDGLPLAVSLVAYAAQGETDLEPTWKRWVAERKRLPTRGEGKQLNAAASFELSINSPRMTEEARSLLRMLSLLPAGAGRDQLEELMGESVWAARTTLLSVGLIHEDSKRLRMLAPVRTHVADVHTATEDESKRVEDVYLRLANTLGPKIGKRGGSVATTTLRREFENCAAVIERSLKGRDGGLWIDAGIALGPFVAFSGSGSSGLLEKTLKAARIEGQLARVANCLKGLGRIALARSDYDAALARYEEALPLFRNIGDVVGEADCIDGIGDAAYARSDYDRAQAKYEEALALYRKAGEVRGEANCILDLGQVAFARSDNDGARARYEEALSLYRKIDAVLGEVKCIEGLGDIAFERSDYEDARMKYEEALPLYRDIGAVMSEANCITSLGNIAFQCSDSDGARKNYEEALPLYRKLGSVLGEANCIHNLGDIAFRRSDYEGARQNYMQALLAYRRLGGGLGEAHCIYSLGDIAFQRSDYQGARKNYEEALPLYRKLGAISSEGNCIFSLGEIALKLSDLTGARMMYEQALSLFQNYGAVLGETNCIKGFADIALRRGNHEEARAKYEQALSLYRKVRSILGEANCIAAFGEMALLRSDDNEAQAKYEQALRLYREVGDVSGEAECIKGLGDVASRRSYQEAQAKYDEAMLLYRKIGNAAGEATCIKGLGDMALARRDPEDARARYQQALMSLHTVGDVLGEANCVKGLGDIARAISDQEGARAKYEEALPLYAKSGDVFFLGRVYTALAEVARDGVERARRVHEARSVWGTLGLPALLRELDDKFGVAQPTDTRLGLPSGPDPGPPLGDSKGPHAI